MAENRWEQQVDRDAGREPCPDRIVEDLGSAFGMGCVGGFIWHFVKGARNSPKGERLAGALFSAKSRAPILGGNFAVWGGTFSTFDCTLQYIRRRDDHWNNIASGFLTGGVLAARGGWKQGPHRRRTVRSSLSLLLIAMSLFVPEFLALDPVHEVPNLFFISLLAGMARSNSAILGKGALVGGVILAVIEGVAALMMRSTSKTPREQQLEMLQMEQAQQDWAKQQQQQATNGTPEQGGFFGSSFGSGSFFGGSTPSGPSTDGAHSNEFAPEQTLGGGLGPAPGDGFASEGGLGGPSFGEAPLAGSGGLVAESSSSSGAPSSSGSWFS